MKKGVIYKCDCCGKEVAVTADLEKQAKMTCSIDGHDVEHSNSMNTFQIPEEKIIDNLLTVEMTEIHLCGKCADKFLESYLNVIAKVQSEYLRCLVK